MDDSVNGDGGNYFLIPNDCYVIYVTGCGGGSGGFAMMSTASSSGAQGGGAAAALIRYPLAVIPNGFLSIRIGRGGLGGQNPDYNKTWTNNSSDSDELISGTWIIGDLVGPEIWTDVPAFGLGFGGLSPSTARGCRGNTCGSESELSFSTSGAFKGYPFNLTTPALSWENGGNAFATLTGENKAAIRSGVLPTYVGGGQTGPKYGSYAAVSYGHFGYSDGGISGPGGGGGGNPFGSGGAGGIPSVNNGAGGTGGGYGSGGGGGCYNSPGGRGGHGFLLFEY